MVDVHGKKVDGIKAQILELTTLMHRHEGSMQSYAQMGRVARSLESGAIVNNLKDVTWIK